MIVTHKVVYNFTVNHREFILIRRALEKFGGQGSRLVTELLDQQRRAIDTLERNFQAAISLTSKTEEEEK